MSPAYQFNSEIARGIKMNNQEKINFVRAYLPAIWAEEALTMYTLYENYMKQGYPRFIARARAGIYGDEDNLAA